MLVKNLILNILIQIWWEDKPEFIELKLPDCRGEIKKLTEGMCNVTHHIVFDDDSDSILKIVAEDTTGNTSNEINLRMKVSKVITSLLSAINRL